jgi:hypothetical protein
MPKPIGHDMAIKGSNVLHFASSDALAWVAQVLGCPAATALTSRLLLFTPETHPTPPHKRLLCNAGKLCTPNLESMHAIEHACMHNKSFTAAAAAHLQPRAEVSILVNIQLQHLNAIT